MGDAPSLPNHSPQWHGDIAVPDRDTKRNAPPTGRRATSFAYIICIDKYKSEPIKNLNGCEKDGNKMAKFLQEKLQVPKSHITRLDNEAATSDAIVSLLKKASSNDSIKQGDLMVFFFAGHGGRSKGLNGWKTDDGRVETICPHDMGAQDDGGKHIYGIPDFAVASHLGRLAARGVNVVSIFDSCHSGGMGRDTNGYRMEPRSSVSRDIPEEELTKLLHEYPEAQDGFNQAKCNSFTLLAACGKRETAHESCTPNGVWGGDFTNALIEALSTLPLDKMSYTALRKSLCIPSHQNPEFAGVTNRIIFTLDEANDDGLYFDINARDDGRYTVQKAGIALGIGPGTRFKILTRDSQEIGSLVVEGVEAFQCEACANLEGDSTGNIPEGARAVLYSWCPYGGPLRVALGDGVEVPQKTVDGPARFQMVEPSEADVIIIMGDNAWEVERRDPLIPVNTGLPIVPYPKKDGSTLEDVLNGIAHFNYQLYRQSDTFLNEAITVELYRLQRGIGRRFQPESPDKPINLLVNNRLDVCFPPKTPYGILIKNSSQHALYPYLFYFNPSRYSIVRVYLPPDSRNTPLPANGEFPIGYGESSVRPLSFTLSDERQEQEDVGFLRLFLSETYVPMEAIEQAPFTVTGATQREFSYFDDDDDDRWGARTIIVHTKRNTHIKRNDDTKG